MKSVSFGVCVRTMRVPEASDPACVAREVVSCGGGLGVCALCFFKNDEQSCDGRQPNN
jgi:hypothetical protein